MLFRELRKFWKTPSRSSVREYKFRTSNSLPPALFYYYYLGKRVALYFKMTLVHLFAHIHKNPANQPVMTSHAFGSFITYLLQNFRSKDIFCHKKHSRDTQFSWEMFFHPLLVSLGYRVFWSPQFIRSILLRELEDTN